MEKQENKELLLKDLCARLLYSVKCSFDIDDAVYEITGVNSSACGASEIQATHVKSGINGDFSLSSCKLYLFPLSSMTKEQRKEMHNYSTVIWNNSIDSTPYEDRKIYCAALEIEWLNKNHFDYRGLIEKGLAIDATELNIY